MECWSDGYRQKSASTHPTNSNPLAHEVGETWGEGFMRMIRSKLDEQIR